MQTQPAPPTMPRRSRARRWFIGMAILLVLLSAYAIALRWFVQRVDSGVQDSLHAIPAVQQDEPPG